MVRPVAAQRHAGERGVLQFPHQEPKLRPQGRRAHHLATPRGGPTHKRGDAAQRQLHGAGMIRQRDPGRHGHTVPLTAHAGDSPTRLRGAIQHRLVGIRAQRPEAVDMAHHEPRMALRQRLEIEPHARQRRGPVVADEHIRLGQQPLHHRAPQRRVQVQRHRALAFVHGKKLGAQGIRRQRVIDAAVITAQVAHWRLHLDDLGAHVGEEEPCPRPLDGRAQLHHLEPLKRPRHRLPSSLAPSEAV